MQPMLPEIDQGDQRAIWRLVELSQAARTSRYTTVFQRHREDHGT